MINIRLPDWIPYDKALHFVIGLIIYSIGIIGSAIIGFVSYEVSSFNALCLVVVMALIKEIDDTICLISNKKTGFDFVDILVTITVPTATHLLFFYNN